VLVTSAVARVGYDGGHGVGRALVELGGGGDTDENLLVLEQHPEEEPPHESRQWGRRVTGSWNTQQT